MRGSSLVVAVFAVGCVQSSTDTCPDDSVCREGTTCHAVEATMTYDCVTDAQRRECNGLDEGDTCGVNDGGQCYSGACLPVICGNGRVDRGEACDDGNTELGDQCSPTCGAMVCGNGELDPIRYDENGIARPLEQCDEGDLRGHDGCSSSCQAELPRWRELPGIPTPRTLSAMASDEPGGKLVVFGGFENLSAADEPPGPDDFILGPALAETWELTRGGWNRIQSLQTPPPRGAHAMTFDGERTILFGGTTGSGGAPLGDTWQYRNGGWTPLNTTTVGASEALRRYGHAMVFVPGTGVVLFGGASKSGVSDETWVYADNQWTLKAYATRPTARIFHTMAYDPVRDVVVLAGGVDSVGIRVDQTPQVLRDSWELGPGGWSPIGNRNGPDVFGASAAYDAVARKVVVTGGRTGIGSEDFSMVTWSYDAGASSWQPVDVGPTPRFGLVSGTNPETLGVTVFGGRTELQCGFQACPTTADPWDLAATTTFDGWAFTPRGYVPAPVLADHGVAYDVERRRAVVFGGTSGAGGEDRTFEIIEGTWIEKRPVVSPPARRAPHMAYGKISETQKGTLMFGGLSAGLLTDTWLWDGTAWTAITGASPAGRRFGTMVFDSARRRFVLFGGQNADNTFRNDTWEFGPSGWTLATPTTKPPGRMLAAMVYDPAAGKTWLWGGRNDSTPGDDLTDLDDLWSYDGTTWTQHTPALAPGGHAAARMTYDPGRRVSILYGGGPPATNEAWEWNGSTWTFVSTFEVPPVRFDHILFPHPLGGVIAHGGTSGAAQGPQSSQYRLVRETTETYAACHSQIDDDGDGAVGCADPDCWATCTPWCAPGTTCDDTQPRCGDGICQCPREGAGICPEDCADRVCD